MLRDIALLSKSSKLSSWDARYKLFVFLGTPVVLSFDRNGLVSSLVNLAAMILFMWSIKVPLKTYIRFSGGLLLFLMLGAIPVVWETGLYSGLVLLARGVSTSASIYMFSATTPIEDLFFHMSKLKATREIAEIGIGMMRFMFVLEEEFKNTRMAVEARYGFGSLKNRVLNTGKLAGAVFRGAIRSWRDIESSLKSRGYRGKTSFMEREYVKPRVFLLSGIAYNLLLAVIANKT